MPSRTRSWRSKERTRHTAARPRPIWCLWTTRSKCTWKELCWNFPRHSDDWSRPNATEQPCIYSTICGRFGPALCSQLPEKRRVNLHHVSSKTASPLLLLSESTPERCLASLLFACNRRSRCTSRRSYTHSWSQCRRARRLHDAWSRTDASQSTRRFDSPFQSVLMKKKIKKKYNKKNYFL